MGFSMRCACSFVLLFALIHASTQYKSNDIDVTDFKYWVSQRNNFKEKENKFIFNALNNRIGVRQPPPIDKYALMARYIVNQADWSSVATISSQQELAGYPFATITSVSDGVKSNGSGIPYMYLTPLDYTAQDLKKDNRATLLMTLAQGDYCKEKDYDPMDPRCARVMLTGRILKLENGTAEHAVAKEAMFTRHPWLAHMPPGHHFFFAKLDISSIILLDTFGGPEHITVEDYLNA